MRDCPDLDGIEIPIKPTHVYKPQLVTNRYAGFLCEAQSAIIGGEQVSHISFADGEKMMVQRETLVPIDAPEFKPTYLIRKSGEEVMLLGFTSSHGAYVQDRLGARFRILFDNLSEIEEKPMQEEPVAQSRPGKMSGDRIHFTIPARLLSRKSYVELLRECFGISHGSFNRTCDLNIVCRPSQFARFVVLRHTKHKETNDLACLNMKLVSPAPPANTIDCSRNPNTARGEAA